MAPQFESKGAGVTVKDDTGRILGTAYPYGQPLTSEGALAQLGYVADEHEPGGIRRIGAAPALTTPEADAGALAQQDPS